MKAGVGIIVLLVVLLAVIIPMCSYVWGFMFSKGFFSGMTKYFNKLKTNKTNEQKETK